MVSPKKNKNKKHSDIFFPHCRTHATTTGVSTASPARHWPSPMRQPSRPDAACPLRLTVVARPFCSARSRPSRSPIQCHSRPSRALPTRLSQA
jgi:hypothetical protein